MIEIKPCMKILILEDNPFVPELVEGGEGELLLWADKAKARAAPSPQPSPPTIASSGERGFATSRRETCSAITSPCPAAVPPVVATRSV